MNLAPVIARLQSQIPQLRKVGVAADIPTAQELLKQVPAAFVVPLAETADSNELESGAISQAITYRFGVLWAAMNLRDASGEAAQNDLEAIRSAGKTALLGWQPDGTMDPCLFGGGQLLQVADRVLWWQDVFVTGNYLRKT